MYCIINSDKKAPLLISVSIRQEAITLTNIVLSI